MNRQRHSALIAALLGLTALLTGCGTSDGSGTFYGPAQMLGQGMVRTYVVLGPDGNPTEVGLRMAAAALDGLPEEDAVSEDAHGAHGGALQFPPEASGMVFDHAVVNWSVDGHNPTDVFGVPHFDFHFYMDDPASLMAIDPDSPTFAVEAAEFPADRYVPQDFAPPPGEPVESAVPVTGLHWTDATQNLTPGEYEFDSIFLNGSWDGRYTFMEPMITRDFLASKTAVDEAIKQPAAYQHTGYYPTRYLLRFDEAAQEHVIVLGGMTMRQRS